jgi:hypothetical protein
MVADGMLTRKRYREVPPRVDYELTERASELMPILGELARWGYEWAWSAPRSTERVDVGAIFRLAPGLVDASGLRGTVQCTVTGGPTYSFAFTGDEVEVSERADDDATAKINGTTEAWVLAFSPEPDRDSGGLEIEGDRNLARALLEGLTVSAPGTQRRVNAA